MCTPYSAGIYPREPRSRKKANKGNSAPTSFYYSKDIQYLQHEPVLRKLREHKAFAKKLSRAIGRGEWTIAKGLEERKPVYRLDHIIKERCVRCCKAQMTFFFTDVSLYAFLTESVCDADTRRLLTR